ncbi:hypothetical protein [Methanobacterium sp. CWC-01]|uniref:hypothetical protein n=1 Tax=Methanobacterium aridiramus TaxID=2584467 RepID=UPI002575D9FA|nr:hypothetical protein [Methanobacterium sp. CWC-01]
MNHKYFKKIPGTMTEYPRDEKKSKNEKNCIKEFKISTDKYKKRDMTVEIIEYEIKD